MEDKKEKSKTPDLSKLKKLYILQINKAKNQQQNDNELIDIRNLLNKTQQISHNGNLKKNKSKHEQMLEEDLKLYKAEVENRFKKSDANRNYIYPRLYGNNADDSNFHYSEGKVVSIYDTNILVSSSRESLTIKKSQSQERKKLKMTGHLHSILKGFIREEAKTKCQSKESFYNTQKLDFNKQINDCKTTMESYTGISSQTQKIELHQNEKRKQAHSEEPRIDERSREILSLIESTNFKEFRIKKKHCRTHTYNLKETKGIQTTINEKRCGKDVNHRKSKTRSNMKGKIDSLNNITAHKGRNFGSHITNKVLLGGKARGRNQLANTLNFSNLTKTHTKVYRSNSKKSKNY